LATSFQSRVTGCGTPVAPPAGLTNVGATGVGGGAGFTVNVADRVTPPPVPEIVAMVVVVTEVVVTVKVALVAPVGTVTLAGTETALESSESDTTAGPGVAAAKVTVPVEELPPTTVAGLTVTALSTDEVGELMVIGANRIVSPSLAVSWTVVAETLNVVTVKLALVAPAGTVTLAGTVAEPGRLLDSVMMVPPEGAALASLTVPVDGLPPVTLAGLTVNDERTCGGGGVPVGFTDKAADWVTPPPVTEIVTTVGTVTNRCRMEKLPVVLPARTMTLVERNGKTVGLLLVS
jgi:hypothetical protein